MKIESEFSSKQAGYFDEITESRGDAFFAHSPALAAEFHAIVGHMHELSQKNILDVGCGSGRHSIQLARMCREVVGTDISSKSIELANSNARKEGINNFTAVVSDYSEPFRRKFFDYALMVNAVHHINDPIGVFRNIKESLTSDGELVIFEFNPMNPLFIPFLIFHKQVRAHFNTQYPRSNIWSLKKMLRAGNFEIIGITRYGFLPTVLYNYSSLFRKINDFLNGIPILNQFCAFHVIRCKAKQ